jgi:hypothetical protein
MLMLLLVVVVLAVGCDANAGGGRCWKDRATTCVLDAAR